MPKYMIEVNYVGAGIKGLLKDGGTTRREIVEQMMSELGCKLESFYYAMGPTDLYIIVDGPDNVTALAGTMTAAASGDDSTVYGGTDGRRGEKVACVPGTGAVTRKTPGARSRSAADVALV